MTATLALVLAAVSAAYRLVDSTGEPVRGATVRVVGRVASTVTDDEGRFWLDPEPSPPFDLVVLGSHGALLGRARVANAGPRVLRLQLLESEQVTVRGAPLPATSPSPAAAATELSRETLEAKHPVLLADAVEEVPGAEAP
jgi:hypothetical protein